MKEDLFRFREFQQNGKNEEVIEEIERIKNPSKHLQLIKNISLIYLGKMDNPTKIFQEFVKIKTSDESFLSDIALLAILSGELEYAWDRLYSLIEQKRADAVVYGRAAAVALAKADLKKAKEYYQEAVNKEAGRAEWHNNLAGIYVREQQLQKALEHYDIALKLKEDFIQAKNSRTKVLIALERTDEVIEELERELKEDDKNYELRIRLSRAYMLANRFQEAIQNITKELIKIDDIKMPDEDKQKKEEIEEIYDAQVAYRFALCEFFMEKNRWYKALLAIEQLEKLEIEERLALYLKKIHIYTEMGKFDKAEETLKEAKKEFEDDNRLKSAEASYLCEKGEYDKAESIQRELLEIYPADAFLKSALGQTLLWIGRLEEAGRLFEEASELNPMALAQMVNAKKYPQDEKSIELMRSMVDNPLIAKQARETMGFAVSEVYEKNAEYDKAFEYLKIANDLIDKEINYDPEVFTKRTDAIIKVFSKEFMDSLKEIRETDRTPIFVVGMPRSGTTLCEQILCSHKEIYGAGELDSISRLTGLMQRVLKSKRGYPFNVPLMTPHLREEAARFYMHTLGFHDTLHHYVVDKMPHNFQHLGLICAILPKAKIIHIQRDPRDIAVSNYQQNFKAKHGGMGYSFNLEKIAKQINDYYKIMQHYRDIDIPMFELTYEELVTNTDELTRELLEYIGVGYDERVKEFHKTKRAVRTASVSQVRQPIYTTSKQKWRRYEKHLEPLLENFNDNILKRLKDFD